nr:DUF4194 domain-containing protein [Cellulomonas marina]
MEDDAAELFAGDRGTLEPDVRRVLVRLLQRRFLTAERSPAQWRTLLEHQSVLESRLHDLFVRLVVDHDRGIAWKEQVRSGELDVPILLRDEAYTRAETLVLVHLRSVHQHEAASGGTAARVDLEEVEQGVLTYFDLRDGDVSRAQREIRDAVTRLAAEGLLDEESTGRYRITPLVEVALDTARLVELTRWLAEQTATREAGPSSPGTVAPDEDLPDEDASDEEDPQP